MTQDEIIAAVEAAQDRREIPLREGCGCGCGYTRPAGVEIRSPSIGFKVTHRTLYQHPPSARHERPDFEAGGGTESKVEAI